jgi:hypothetical protein
MKTVGIVAVAAFAANATGRPGGEAGHFYEPPARYSSHRELSLCVAAVVRFRAKQPQHTAPHPIIPDYGPLFVVICRHSLLLRAMLTPNPRPEGNGVRGLHAALRFWH